MRNVVASHGSQYSGLVVGIRCQESRVGRPPALPAQRLVGILLDDDVAAGAFDVPDVSVPCRFAEIEEDGLEDVGSSLYAPLFGFNEFWV